MPDALSITVKEVSVHLGGRHLLEVPDLTIETGQKYLITGRSGSGKTLCLKLLMGQLPTSSVSAKGRFTVSTGKTLVQNYSKYRRNQVVARRLSTIFQDAINSLHPYRSIAAQLSPIPCCEVCERFKTFNLNPNDFLNPQKPRYSKYCSGGECQRISILSALLRPERDIFLFDEPLTDIDLISRLEIEQDISQILCDKARTVILVTHNTGWLSGIDLNHFNIEDQKLIFKGKGNFKKEDTLNENNQIKWSNNSSNITVLRFSVSRQFKFPNNDNFEFLPFDEEIKMVQGEGLALIGESGCGKTSLLKMIAGLMPEHLYGKDFKAEIPWAGDFTPVQKIPRQARYGLLQLVLQDTTMTLITEEPIQKSLDLICQLKGMNNNNEDKQRFKKLAADWMAHLQLSPDDLLKNNKRIKELSLGMMRRFSLLRAFLLLDIYNQADQNKPKLLLLDEISRGLDPISLDQVVSGLSKFCEENNTIIIAVSHDIEFVSRVCSRARIVQLDRTDERCHNGKMLPRDIELLGTPEDREILLDHWPH
jgi:ABC-type glutathione transport system ATPase component